ncbi:hypothetical protein ACERK3_03790 [Phycisphaerales bacterium AB-hyl4]|uniref:Tetratricopeptide repeat protein n=1 Tax=Natronomicrosphaera hydrolytica TaxID=3242702 RepID=A0ABV4U237_9BACT
MMQIISDWIDRPRVIVPVAFVCLALLSSMGVKANAEPVDEPEWLELTVTPAPEPSPALQHRFRAPIKDQRRGNAVPMYARAMIFLGFVDWEDVGPRVRDWQGLALDELPVDEIRSTIFGQHLAFLDEAALYDHAAWETAARQHGVAALLPELGQMRNHARLLALRTRVHIREGDHEQAIASLRTGYTMAAHVAEEPIVISRLVGISIAVMMSDAARELMASPGSPNLYWALADVGRDYIDLRAATEFERYWVHWNIPALSHLSDVPMSIEQADRLWHDVFTSGLASEFGGVTWEHPLPAMALGTAVYSEAKAGLVERGHDAEAVEAMPVKQAILLHWLIELEHWADELFKWHQLPYAEAWEGARRSDQAFEHHRGRLASATNPFLNVLPALGAARGSEERMRRRFALLRCVEAVRMHVAANDGQLPASLDDITVVPAPRDPSSHLPFRYHLEDNGRTFTLEPEPGEGPRLRMLVGDRLRVTVANDEN